MMTSPTRRSIIAAAASLAVPNSALAGRTVRIGYQKYGNLLLLKASGILEQKLKPLGYAVEWRQFIAGPPLMEALAAGAIDFGGTGETAPIFAQAAGTQIVYLAAQPPAPHGEALLVLEGSPIKTLTDLRGKRIALTKGTNVHNLVVKAIEKGGLQLEDVTLVHLPPTDGRVAFEHGRVDAWAIWDPFLAAAQATGHTRVLTDGEGLVANHQFYLGAKSFTDRVAIDLLVRSIEEIDRRTDGNPRAAASTLSPEIGLPAPVIANALARHSWAITRMTADLVARQQAIADTFFRLGLIPKAIQVADVAPLN